MIQGGEDAWGKIYRIQGVYNSGEMLKTKPLKTPQPPSRSTIVVHGFGDLPVASFGGGLRSARIPMRRPAPGPGGCQ